MVLAMVINIHTQPSLHFKYQEHAFLNSDKKATIFKMGIRKPKVWSKQKMHKKRREFKSLFLIFFFIGYHIWDDESGLKSISFEILFYSIKKIFKKHDDEESKKFSSMILYFMMMMKYVDCTDDLVNG